jgi:MFS family permease
MSPRTRLVPELPRSAWLLVGGESLSAFGGGLTLPFLLVYLHEVRGLELELAGLALACLAAAGFAANPLGGLLSDRCGARTTLVAGLLGAAAGAAWFALASQPWHAFAAAAALGMGAGVALPAQDVLLARLAGARQLSAAFALRHATLNAGLGAGSVAGALIVDAAEPGSFARLFLLQATMTAAFAAIAAVLPDARPPQRRRAAAGYRAALADGRLRRLLPVVALLFAAGYGQYHAALPAYALGAGAGTAALGAAFAANTFTIVGAQLLVARAVRRQRRSRCLALAACTWAAAWAIVLATGGLALGLCLAMVVFGIGETLLAPTLDPWVNELAPDDLRGRYNGASRFASTSGFVVGPAASGALLGAGLATALVAGLALTCALVAVLGLRVPA